MLLSALDPIRLFLLPPVLMLIATFSLLTFQNLLLGLSYASRMSTSNQVMAYVKPFLKNLDRVIGMVFGAWVGRGMPWWRVGPLLMTWPHSTPRVPRQGRLHQVQRDTRAAHVHRYFGHHPCGRHPGHPAGGKGREGQARLMLPVVGPDES